MSLACHHMDVGTATGREANVWIPPWRIKEHCQGPLSTFLVNPKNMDRMNTVGNRKSVLDVAQPRT